MSKVTIGEQIMKLNTDMSYVKKEVGMINNKIDDFIKNANATYANKQEVHYLEQRVNRLDLDNEAQWKKLLKISERLALVVAIVFLIAQNMGLTV